MATHNAEGKELFVCGNCKCRRTADEYDVDRHGHRRKGCIPCRLKREGKVVTPGRVCEDCGASHKNRSDNKCNTCRLVKCALCQEGFRRCYQNHKLCHRCFYNPPKVKRTPNPPSATNFHGPSMPVTVEHTPWHKAHFTRRQVLHLLSLRFLWLAPQSSHTLPGVLHVG